MLTTSHAIYLALLQGFTEFLPISSSGHLILIPSVLGWPDQGQAFDVAVHLGSLMAVIIYFFPDMRVLCGAVPKLFAGRRTTDTQFLIYLIIGSIPVLVVGSLAAAWLSGSLRHPLIIAMTMFGFGLFLWYADYRRGEKQLADMDIKSALYIGLAQVLALIPGTSRSGITMSMAMLLGYSRKQAARFSFLLSIPVIGAASAYKLIQFVNQPPDHWPLFILALVVSFLSALLAIRIFLNVIERLGVVPFVIYRFILAIAIIAYYF